MKNLLRLGNLENKNNLKSFILKHIEDLVHFLQKNKDKA